MEQLSGETIERLLARARAGVLVPERALPGALPAEPWARPRTASPAEPAPAPAFTTEPSLLPVGVERRLVRRAEALWASLAGVPGRLPAAEAAAQLLAPPYAGQALILSLPAQTADRDAEDPSIVFVGEALLGLGLLAAGPAPADARPEAPLGARLVALATRAAATGQPAHFDSEAEPAPPRWRPQLLMRAVALPFAATAGAGPTGAGATGGEARVAGTTVAVITSWRKLLSSEETAALHRELAAAIDWMRQHRP